MIIRQGKSLKVDEIRISENYAMVTCKLLEFKAIRNYLQIGESITTEEHFALNFNGCKSKWKIIFYPRGQYDFGTPSNDFRLYLMLISCEKAAVKMNIQAHVTLKSSQSRYGNTVSSGESESLFVSDDKMRNWAGPFAMQFSEGDYKHSEILKVKCTFRVIANESNECKRSLSDADDPLMSSSKRSRSKSFPPVKEDQKNVGTPMSVDDHFESSPKPSNAKPKSPTEVYEAFTNLLSIPTTKSKSSMEVDVHFEIPPNPFTTKSKSPILYNRLTLPLGGNASEKSVTCRRGRYFQYEKPSSRTIIFTPDEREALRKAPAASGRKLSLLQSDSESHQSAQPKKFRSSGCLKVPEIVPTEETDPDKQNVQSCPEEKPETSASDSNTLLTSDDDDETSDKITFREKIHYYKKKF